MVIAINNGDRLAYFWLSNFARRFRHFFNQQNKNQYFSENAGLLSKIQNGIDISKLVSKFSYKSENGHKRRSWSAKITSDVTKSEDGSNRDCS